MWVTHLVSNNHCELAGTLGEEYILFHCCVLPGSSLGDTHVNLEMLKGSFHDPPYLVKKFYSPEFCWILGSMWKPMFLQV